MGMVDWMDGTGIDGVGGRRMEVMGTGIGLGFCGGKAAGWSEDGKRRRPVYHVRRPEARSEWSLLRVCRHTSRIWRFDVVSCALSRFFDCTLNRALPFDLVSCSSQFNDWCVPPMPLSCGLSSSDENNVLTWA